MKTIKIIIYLLIAFALFGLSYMTFETQHQFKELSSELNSVRLEQEKISYLIENQQDTIIVNAYVKLPETNLSGH